jgi:penicillin-binding protein 2
MTLLSQRREVGEFKKRYKWMVLAVLCVFAVLAGRAIQLQIFQHEHYAAIARENITKTIPLPATRGLVRDTAGRVIASNRPGYDVYVTPQLVAPEHIPRIAELMELEEEETTRLRTLLDEVPLQRRTHQILAFREIDRDQLAALETHARDLPGVDVVAVPVREYAYGSLGGHAVGYLNEVSAEDLERLADQDYGAGDRIGRMGVERAWESYLRGRDGFRRVLVDARGVVQDSTREDRSHEMRREPSPGRDITLALDMELMRTIDRAFRGQPSGAAVVVDVRTGRIRALYSKPTYDLNEMSGHLTSARYAELEGDPFRPLIDKTIYESYFPGSTFKVVTALAALEDGVFDPATRVTCPGYFEIGNERKRCTSAHGDVDMRQAIVQSCNVYFWTMAQEVGLERLNRFGHDFGFGAQSGVGINSEASGFLPSREWYAEHFGRFRVGYTLDAAIGQGNTRSTLLQLAMSYAAIANGGTLFVPQLVERVSSPDGETIEEFEPRVRRRIGVSREHLAYVIDGLYGVVNDPNGTAYDARIENGVPVAGKTGTAQVARRQPREGEDPRRTWYFNRDHAWFAGFAPAGDPEIAIVVLVEHGGGGGKYAAPIATQVIQDYLGSRDATAAATPTTGTMLTRAGVR